MIPKEGEDWKAVQTGVRLRIKEVHHLEDGNIKIIARQKVMPSHWSTVELNLPPVIFDSYFRKEILLPCTSCTNNTFNLLKQEVRQLIKDIVDGYGSTIEDGRRVVSHLQCRKCKEEFIRFDTHNKAEMSVADSTAIGREFISPIREMLDVASIVKIEKPDLGGLFTGTSSLDCPICSDSETRYPMNSASSNGITTYTCGLCEYSEKRDG